MLCQTGCRLPRAGSMATPGSSGSFNSLTRRHGVKIDSVAGVEECSLAVGEAVGHENIVSASRMNSAVVVFMKTVDLANQLVENGIVINGIFIPVLPLSTPSKKVTLSNVPPFIPNEVLIGLLARYGKTVSPIKMIPIGTKSPLLKHVVSFRRYVYMILQDNIDELDLSLSFRHEEFNYVIFATTNNMKCFNCGIFGHMVRACPGRQDKSNERPSHVLKDGNMVNENVNRNAAVLVADAEVPGPSSVQTAVAAAVTLTVDEERAVSSEEDDGMMVTVGEDKEVENRGCVVDTVDKPPVILESVTETELDDCAFKTPLKRRLEQRPSDQQAKKGLVCDVSQTDTESESDFSECSVECSVPLSGFSNKSYSSDDIKSFLKATKNARKVRIEEHFPDVLQFIEKAKIYRSEGCFNNQEIYRLKKILAKLNAQPESNSCNEK